MRFNAYFLVGGAGFIGSHFIDALLAHPETAKVTVFDNFSSGKAWFYQQHNQDPRFFVVKGDAKDREALQLAMANHEVVMHFAANPDIARAMSDPAIDFIEGFYLTHQVLEAARLTHVKRLIYTSGSGVYGEVAGASGEDQSGMYPISTYGASKLASEAFISSYCHMFDLSACVFRFANVVGPRQTHGVGYDFINKLKKNPSQLAILGDGQQTKSYVHISDVVNAVFLANEALQDKYAVFNVATNDTLSVQEIAQLTVRCMGITQPVTFQYTGGDRGWKGDVPVVHLNTEKMRALGWQCQYSSFEAMRHALLAMIEMP
ncbi:MAG: NAD-dependent epimerase/dehydratase family protein [Tatlockia sp.]|jgi:UDP-glucose 4-epimerase